MPPDAERALIDWLIEAGLRDHDERELLGGLCERLKLAGLGLSRVLMASQLLHPQLQARGFLWRGDGVVREEYGGGAGRDPGGDWPLSPFYHMVHEGLDSLRIRLDHSLTPGRFPLLDRLRAEGGTDYFATARRFTPERVLGDLSGVAVSWTTDRPGGFAESELALLERCASPLALGFKGMAAIDTARTLTRTYLGQDVAMRVLGGGIRRGEALPIEAVLWSSDLVGFTRIADTTAPDRLMALLNAYAEVVVDVVERHGGDVLKFMGDGILAIFRDDDAAERALDAAIAARHEVRALNEGRRRAGEPTTDFHLGLHRGEVLYGNIGSAERLDFTVIGPAVNEVARIEAMCRSLERRVIVSKALARTAGAARDRLVSLGRYALKGVGRAQELYTIDPLMLGPD